ncbi:unnamed protein product [Rhizophagus irregularis]|nr:unnamed protein product [Rhizophagus irregularis]
MSKLSPSDRASEMFGVEKEAIVSENFPSKFPWKKIVHMIDSKSSLNWRKVAEESNEKREVHLERDRERKRRKVAEESNEEREAHLECDQKRKQRKVAEETNETRLARDQKRKERQIPEEIYEEYEARLEAEEEVRRACARNKYQLRKARKTPKQFAARLSQNKPNIRRKRVSESSESESFTYS